MNNRIFVCHNILILKDLRGFRKHHRRTTISGTYFALLTIGSTMNKRLHIFFFITALILILLILGLTPVRFIQKLGSSCLLEQKRVSLSCNPCIYHSMTSRYHLDSDNTILLSPSIQNIFQSLLGLKRELIFLITTIDSNPSIESPPLRC